MTKSKSTDDERRIYYWSRVRNYCEKNKNLNWCSSEVILNLVYTYDLFRSRGTHVLSKFDLSAAAMNILMVLHFGVAQGYKQQELSSLLLVTRANMTKVIDGMEKRGLVMRSASEKDRRARFIKITAGGEDLAKKLIIVQTQNAIKYTSQLSQSEKAMLNNLLVKLSKSISESEKEK